LQVIKSFLVSAGVRHLSVKFDAPNKCVEASFLRAGKQYEKTITFAEIEQFLSDLTPSNTEV
jgi:hypothetical protein